MQLAWGSRVPEWFRDRVVRIGVEGRFDPSWLMASIKFESNFDPQARNPNSSASGLIQWMEATAIDLGTTIEAIRAMTSMEQLELVDKYFRPFFGHIHSLSDCYAVILKPSAVGLPEDAVIFPAGSKAELANRGLDINHDGDVTKAEATAFVAAALTQGLQPGNVFEVADTQPAAPIDDQSTTIMEQPKMGGLLGGLLMSVVSKFINPTVAQSATSIINKDGLQSTAAQSLLEMLLNAVASAAGTTPAAMKADDKVAIAATAAVQADTAKLQQVEDAAAAHLAAVLPWIDKLAQIDQMLWEAQNKGKQTVSTIAIEEHKAGLWDMTPTLVLTVAILMGLVSIGLLAAIIAQSMTGDHQIDSGLIGLAGPIWTGAVVSTFVAMISYRFDGTKESHAAAEAQQSIKQYRDETRGNQ